MTEDYIYKVAVLRCPACERSFESEIELLQPCKAGDLVLDSCPGCGFLGDFKILHFLLALLFFGSLSWGACGSGTAGYNISSQWCGTAPNLPRCCSLNDYECPSTYYQLVNNYYHRYYIFTSKNYYCPSPEPYQGSFTKGCQYSGWCDTQAEADSVYCELNPDADGCSTPCDSTKWECETSVERSQTTIASDNVTCIGGACFGGVYCEYITKNTTTCTNECGGTTTQENSIPIRYDGACNPDNLTDDDECTGVRCISFAETKSYSLYKLCKSREIVNGEQKFLPRIVGGGRGNCASNGYPESNDSTAFSGSSDSLNVPESCFTMGLGCPPPDTTSYTAPDDRTAENGCTCVPYDGMPNISKIICPDASISVFMGSCDQWKQPPTSSSSSFEPPVSCSGSETPASSGGGDLVGDWANYSQGEQIIALLGAVANNTIEKSEIKQIQTLNVALDDYTTLNDDVDVPFSRTDSIYDPSYVIDTAGLKNAIFGRVTEQNEILDTLLHPASKCPCFTFFSSGGSQAQISGSHISLPKMVFDFADFHGFDLCHIISVIVTSLASVVAFFIGFAIFKNVSQ